MTLREKIEVMEAFERGEEIEASFLEYGIWEDETDPNWSWTYYEYRIKPKPKPKQVIVLETWLCAFENDYYMSEATAGYFEGIETVKLLSTREVEL